VNFEKCGPKFHVGVSANLSGCFAGVNATGLSLVKVTYEQDVREQNSETVFLSDHVGQGAGIVAARLHLKLPNRFRAWM
jgi:hypothetical protein